MLVTFVFFKINNDIKENIFYEETARASHKKQITETIAFSVSPDFLLSRFYFLPSLSAKTNE